MAHPPFPGDFFSFVTPDIEPGYLAALVSAGSFQTAPTNGVAGPTLIVQPRDAQGRTRRCCSTTTFHVRVQPVHGWAAAELEVRMGLGTSRWFSKPAEPTAGRWGWYLNARLSDCSRLRGGGLGGAWSQRVAYQRLSDEDHLRYARDPAELPARVRGYVQSRLAFKARLHRYG